MAHINSPMLHHKYSTVSKIHPPQTPAKDGWRRGGWGGVNAPYVTLNLYLQMKHKVPYSHGFATLASPPLHIANSFILVKNKIKEHADQSNDNNINNNNIHYDDGMRSESDD